MTNALSLREMTAERAISIKSAGQEYLVSAKDIVSWVAPNAPIQEAKKFLIVCQTLGLNPLVGEIDLLPFNKGAKWGAVVRKNGYLKICRGVPDYDGHESGIVCRPKNATPEGKMPLFDVPGTILPPGCLLVGGWAKVYSKTRTRPVYKRVSIAEYFKDQEGPWKTYTCTMIEKVAIAAAAREAFSIGDAYDEAEYPGETIPERPATQVQVSARIVEPPPTLAFTPSSIHNADPDREPEPPAAGQEDDEPVSSAIADPDGPSPCTEEQGIKIINLIAQLKMTDLQVSRMLDARNVSSIAQLDNRQAQEIINKLESVASRADWNPLESKPAVPSAPAPVVAEVASETVATEPITETPIEAN